MNIYVNRLDSHIRDNLTIVFIDTMKTIRLDRASNERLNPGDCLKASVVSPSIQPASPSHRQSQGGRESGLQSPQTIA